MYIETNHIVILSYLFAPPPAQLIFVIGDKIVMDGDIKRALLIAKDGAS